MKKTDIREIYSDVLKFKDKSVLIGGWVKSARDMKKFAFVTLSDGTCFNNAQIVLDSSLENFEEVAKINAGSSILVEGVLKHTPENKQPFEILATKVTILSKTDESYPLQKKGHSMEFLREIAYLRPRTNLFNAVFRVRSEMAFAIHEFFHSNGFVYVHTPIITGADCEGGSDVFKLTSLDIYNENRKVELKPENDFFGKPVFLTPTGQLEGEALALAYSKIYTFGPTFRAENSNTTRHANEFWMVEPEIAFCDLDGLLENIESLLKYVIRYLLKNCKEEIEYFNKIVDNGLLERLNNVVNSDFARVTYTEAVKILEKHNNEFEFKVKWGDDLQSEHERYLCEKIYKRPVFVTDYPKEIKAFYMRLNDDKKTVAASDLLAPGIGEIVGSSQREERLDVLKQKIAEAGLKEKDYWWYLNLRKFGSVYHSGYGIGFDRFLMYVTGINNIRDVQLFPRTPKNCDF